MPKTLRKVTSLAVVPLCLAAWAAVLGAGTPATAGFTLETLAPGVYALVRTKAPGFWWNLLTAALYLIAGIVLLVNPIAAVLTLTIVLAAYMLATGFSKVLMAFHYKNVIPKAWLWMLFSALVDIALSVIIIAGLPGTAIWVLGLLVGINLLFTGIALLVSAFYCQSADAPAGGSQPAKV